MTKIFVYGTLREGMYNYELYLKGRVTNIQEAYVKGELYQLKGVRYPALLAGEEYITGEIMEIQDEHILKELDEMEGFICTGHPDNEYDRIHMDIYDKQHQKIDYLPVYFYNHKNEQRKALIQNRITSNDFVRFMKEVEV